MGPFPIMEKVSSHAFRLGLSLALSRIHPVFHVLLLQPTTSSEISNRAIDTPPPIELDDSDKWKFIRSWTAGLITVARGKDAFYLVKWKGFDNTPDAVSWEPPEHLANAPMWSKPSTRLTQRTRPLKPLRGALSLSLSYFFAH